jgi:hypothetical protein
MPRIAPFLPDYDDRCTTNIVGQLRNSLNGEAVQPWVPNDLHDVRRVVLLVIDGLGWQQLQQRMEMAPTLNGFSGSWITTAAPTTTPVCLTSIVTGARPAEHGIVSYRMSVEDAGILDAQKWMIDGVVRKDLVDPVAFQRAQPFGGADVPAVIRTLFLGSGFTDAMFHHGRVMGYQFPSSIPTRVRQLLDDGEQFVYTYYDGIDITAHTEGLGNFYDAELRYVDHLVQSMLAALPEDTALVITADHGHVEMTDGYVELDAAVIERCHLVSGDARFRWLHVAPEQHDDVLKRCIDLYDDIAWVRTADEVIAEGWLGGVPDARVRSRMGDIAIAVAAPLGLLDPTSRTTLLASRHGSLTEAEVKVPFLVKRV